MRKISRIVEDWPPSDWIEYDNGKVSSRPDPNATVIKDVRRNWVGVTVIVEVDGTERASLLHADRASWHRLYWRLVTLGVGKTLADAGQVEVPTTIFEEAAQAAKA